MSLTTLSDAASVPAKRGGSRQSSRILSSLIAESRVTGMTDRDSARSFGFDASRFSGCTCMHAARVAVRVASRRVSPRLASHTKRAINITRAILF